MRLAIAVLLFFPAPVAFAANVTVGCPGGTPGAHPSINAALATLDAQGPHTITVTGNCMETIFLVERERLTIQAPTGQTAVITGMAPNQPAITIRASRVIALRNLVIGAGRAAVSIENGSMAVIAGVTAENATNGNAIDVFGGSSVNIGGFNAADAVTMRNSANGMRCEACTAFFPGWVTIEDNARAGLTIDGGRVEMIGQRPAAGGAPAAGGMNIVRNNGVGVVVNNGGVVDLSRNNLIQDNAADGILLTAGGVASLTGDMLPGGGSMGTTIEGSRTGVAALFNSTLRAVGPNRIQNNGVAGEQFRSGVAAAHSSMLWLSRGEITGTTGPGIVVDSGSTARMDGMTVAGNTEEGVRLKHGAVLESIVGNTVGANGSTSVSCDATAVVFGDFAGFAPFECDKKEKTKAK